jgi:hypothetical protein
MLKLNSHTIESYFQSEYLGDVVYQSEWYSANLDLQKNLGLIIQRCQKPFEVQGIFFGISLTTFTDVR